MATHHYPTPDERKESATAGRGAQPRKPPGDPNLGARKKSRIDAHWPTVIIELMEVMTKKEIREAIGVSKHSINDWIAGKRVPGPDTGDALAALYGKRVGGQLPKGKE